MLNDCCNKRCFRPAGGCCSQRVCGATGPRGLRGEKGDKGESGEEFLSCFAEGAANTQVVPADGDFVFGDIEIVGSGITASADGRTFTVTRPGLYSVEWSANLSVAADGSVIGVLENGRSASALTSSHGATDISSGALVNVTTVPFTFSLHNFGSEVEIENDILAEFTSASIRIIRFAAGPI